MIAEDYAKEVTKSAGIHRGHPDEKVVHDAIYNIMGGRYKPVTEESLSRYSRNIENNLYTNADTHLARRVIPHLSSVLKK
jgi:hypothetical protein